MMGFGERSKFIVKFRDHKIIEQNQNLFKRIETMAEEIVNPATKRYALVTGANKGIGFEICRQLASNGVTVILTARNEKRGLDAQDRLSALGLSVDFHQLDVTDPDSIASVAEFIKTKYGRLDILVNNAGIAGIGVDGDTMIVQEVIEADVAAVLNGKVEAVELKASGKFIETFEGAKECVETNYYATKRVTQAFIPLLQLSESPRIVNVSSLLGNLLLLPNEWAKEVLSDEERMTEERVDQVVQEFLNNFKEGSLEERHWPAQVAAYKVSKAGVNAYTRCMAKKYPSVCINSVCPGFARTDMTCNLGPFTAAQAAECPVKLALLPAGAPSGLFYYQKDVFSF